jgi:hypothetical protein
MSERYELIYGFVHCRGRTTYSAGFAQTLSEAEAWVRKNREAPSPAVKAPSQDPIHYCKASWCPFKRQKPWFDIRFCRRPNRRDAGNVERGPDVWQRIILI